MPVKLTFVTGNTTKLREVTAIFARGPHPIEIEAQDFDLPELQGTTRDIARAKCTRAAELVGGPCITDDTALCFAALGGLPGPYIKPFLPLGPDALVALLAGFECKDAWALCTFAYSAGPGSEPVLFEGRTDGTIVPTRGPAHCGWDACFEPSGTGLTYAEMPAAQKNTTSHRYKALEQLRAYLAGNRCDPYHASSSSSSSVGAGEGSVGTGEGEVEEGRSG